jgi:hypothetical protein
VLAITTYTIDELLARTGPITVPGWDITIAPGETTLKILQNTREARGAVQRKAILSDLADALFARLLAMPPREWIELVGAADVFRDQRLIQAWMAAPDAQALVSESGWSGAVRQDAGDYLYAVDANVMPVSKLNLVTRRSMDLRVVLDALGNAENTLTLTWENQIATDLGKPLRDLAVGVGSLEELGTYVRVLVPERSRFGGVAATPDGPRGAPNVVEEVGGRSLFGTYLRVPPGTTSRQYTWTVPYIASVGEAAPDGTATGEYRLVIQRQPGLLTGPLTLTVMVPPGARILDATPGMTTTDAAARLGQPDQATDVVVVVHYSMANP